MALFFFLFLVFLLVGAACWFQGVWSNAVNAVNVVVAGLIATNYYESVCYALEEMAGLRQWVYVLDLPIFWLLFAIAFGILRAISDGLSSTKLEFSFQADMVGRSILAVVTAWLFVCLTAFSLQFAPIGADHWPSENSGSFLFLAPERQWSGLAWLCSRGSLARGMFDEPSIHPDDRSANAQVFNSREFPVRHWHRRKNLETNDGLRANR